MHDEIGVAVGFITRMLGASISPQTKEDFAMTLQRAMARHFERHWNPDRPLKGSAYRCVRSEAGRHDPLLMEAATKAGLELKTLLPTSFVVWVDPQDVSARIGDHGSIFSIENTL